MPDIAVKTGAKSISFAVENENWLPRDLTRQLHIWFAKIGVTFVTLPLLFYLLVYKEKRFVVVRKLFLKVYWETSSEKMWKNK